jgi:RNA recognition motif-containing protein
MNPLARREKRLAGFVRAAQQDCVTFFFTNFPLTENLVGLRRVFGGFGRVRDIFIPSKLTKLGQRFGFVRFKNVIEVNVLLAKLQEVWIGSFKLRVNVSKFGRDSHEDVNVRGSNTGLEGCRALVGDPSRSFLEALTSSSNTHKVKDESPSNLLPLPPHCSVAFDMDSARLDFLNRCL